ncbi:hypothetical protein MCEMAEM6B_00048 [Mycobacteriaceae bacterium]
MSAEIEVVEPLDVVAATRLDKRIRLMAATVRDNLTKIADLVAEAKSGQLHIALGFSSWTAYLADAIGSQIELSTDSRRAVVELLAGEGMSNRAIATAVGVTEGTVRNDKVRSDYAPFQVDNINLKNSAVTGLDGKTYKNPGSASNPPSESESNPPSKQRPRRPLPDAWSAAVQDLARVVERLDRLAVDDRFERNRESLSYRKSDVIRARESLDKLVRQLDGDPTLPGVAK